MTQLERIAAGLACGTAFAWVGASLGERVCCGVVLRVDAKTPSEARSLVEKRVPRISSDALLFSSKVGPDPTRATFQGFLWTGATGPVRFRWRGGTQGRLWCEDALVLSSPGSSDRTTVTMGRGLHRLQAEFDTSGKLPMFRVTVVAESDDSEDSELTLFPSPPSRVDRLLAGTVIPGLRSLGRLLGLATAALGLWLVLGWPRPSNPAGTGDGGTLASARVWVCAIAVVAYAGALRVESVVRQHWGLESPAWARYVAEAATELRPAALKQVPAERPYFGDPTTYLRFAREMERFYDAHVREPLFVAATKGGLALSGGRDVGISLTSTAFSTLLVLATFLLGARAFGPGIGIVAALLLAVEHDAIRLSAQGWRDDAFAFLVAAFIFMLLDVLARPSFGRALLLGVTAGAAGLTRITALSFLLLAFLLAAWKSPRNPLTLERLILALLIAAALVGPFLAASRIVFGDTLYSINAHTSFYRSRASLPADAMGWSGYLASSFTPRELAENLLAGVTRYPFENKWQPYAIWSSVAPGLLRGLALGGLALFLRSPEGRLLLVVLFSALVPFAFTFRITGGNEWRMTLLAYPFYLVAAALALERVRATLARAVRFFASKRRSLS